LRQTCSLVEIQSPAEEGGAVSAPGTDARYGGHPSLISGLTDSDRYIDWNAWSKPWLFSSIG
jgi:hypothetical protein